MSCTCSRMGASSRAAIARSHTSSKSTAMRGSPSAKSPERRDVSAAPLDSLMERTASLGAAEPAWLADSRRAAATALARGGLPNARNEAWKYTNLRALEQRRYASGDADATTRAVECDRLRLPGIDGPRLVFVNGTWRPDLSNVSACDGLSIATLAQATSAELESI